ncbi:tetraspanin-9-like [Tachysurus vachellii]|uniref:tetraspanin-9-like n=1 Tax=Tachysurus vachellii TaxID=175792 RepID=UPI00296AB389|nr:tetraspanin-9-like [Tachysurus vachellii]
MVTGFLGCLGALKEQRCLLMTFFVILLLLFLTEAALVLLLGLFHEELDHKAKENLIEGMMDYDRNPDLKKSWDSMQRIFKCCGVSNHTDWYNRTTEGPPPESCCRDHMPPCHRWEEPCYEKAKAWVLDNITWVLGFGVCLGIMQISETRFNILLVSDERLETLDLPLPSAPHTPPFQHRKVIPWYFWELMNSKNLRLHYPII